ncbi:MAG: DoxX family protein [Bacteroidia bacterium]|nr:DoxX family protein [Bacteroidia bacterium]
MRTNQILYWSTTGLFSAMMLMSATAYLVVPQAAEAFVRLGFPAYFRIELAVFKILGAAALLLLMVPGRVKEWAYSGFAVVIVSALIAHAAIGDGPETWAGIIIAMGLLATSYITYHKQTAPAVA